MNHILSLPEESADHTHKGIAETSKPALDEQGLDRQTKKCQMSCSPLRKKNPLLIPGQMVARCRTARSGDDRERRGRLPRSAKEAVGETSLATDGSLP
mmetsp:Transcript_405/g.1061  ORF Transcript_405/g.1061 Transcript_405/m.1061 type:complete len:98 (-) Transcript_405:105-398(-)